MTGVAPDDRGFTLGDGLFETVLADRGRLVLWPEHMRRLVNGCEVLGLPAPDLAICEAEARRALAAAGLDGDRATVRLTWSAGPGGRGLERSSPLRPRLVVIAAPAPHDPSPVSLATVGVRRNATSPASKLKTLAYLDNVLARREAQAAGADEALMLNTDGHLACTAAANLFWVEADRLFTPALSCGVLGGTVRAALMAELEIAEVAAPREALDRAEVIFLSNSLIGVRPVHRIDGRDVLVGHPLVDHLAKVVAGL